MAEWCGIAFQLTNILRDVEEDARLGRIYLPQEDLARFGVSPRDLEAPSDEERFHALMAFQAARADDYYDRARPLLERIDPVSRPGFAAMVSIYRALLHKIRQEDYRVHGRRIRLSGRNKVALLLRAWASGGSLPEAGAPPSARPPTGEAASGPAAIRQ
jgi:phytoene synthase